MAPRAAFRATSTPGATVGRTVVGAGVGDAVGYAAGLAVGVAVVGGAPYPGVAAEPGLPHAASSAGARISSNAFLIIGSLLSHRVVDIAHKNLSRERDIPSQFGYIDFCFGASLGRQPGGAVVWSAACPACW